VASGRGGPAIYARRKYALDVVGVDITPYNVRSANRQSREKGVSRRAQFVIGNALALPVADASFALAWSIESPAHFPDKPAFLHEVARALKRGGAFAFADMLVVNDVAMASAANRQIYEEFLQVWDVPYLETLEGYQHAMADAGLELCRTEIATRYNLAIFERYCRIFLRLLGFMPIYRVYGRYIKRRTGADLANVCEHVFRSYRALRLGMIDYGLFWAVRR
jgi:SAM-dependent methyltransferase